MKKYPSKKVERVKVSTQVREDILNRARALADSEGRKFQYVVEEALAMYVADKSPYVTDSEVMKHFEESYRANEELYRKLAE